MDLLKPFRKCFYCKKKDNLHSVRTIDMYDSTKYFFHPYCIRQILADPELYEPYVDTAVSIADIIDRDLQRKERREKEYEKIKEKYQNF